MKVKGHPEECFAWGEVETIHGTYYMCHALSDHGWASIQKHGGCTLKGCPFMKPTSDTVRAGLELKELTPRQRIFYKGNMFYDDWS